MPRLQAEDQNSQRQRPYLHYLPQLPYGIYEEELMFGYITANIPELKVKDYRTYQSFYCGLCKSLKKTCGRRGQLTLTYDITFVHLLHTALYEPEIKVEQKRCVLHPFTKHTCVSSPYSQYAADMNLFYTYYKLIDDWKDDKKYGRFLASLLIRRKYKQIKHTYPEKCRIMEEALNQITVCEKRGETNPDIPSGYFGQAFGELLVYKKDEWEHTLRSMGFYFGKFIYLMDAYEDLKEDKETGSYNPLLSLEQEADYEEQCRDILTMMMAECAKEFEKLPVLEYTDILRNILYSGVWSRYKQIQKTREEQTQ